MLSRRALQAVLSLAVGMGLAAASGAGATDFTDRDLLTGTFTLDEDGPLADAQAALAVAEAELAAAQAALDAANAAVPPDPAAIAAAQVEVDAKTIARDQKLAAVQAIEGEIAATAALVQQLSDRQVHALNAALNNAHKAGLLPLDLDAEQLQRILDGDYGVREIQALTMAYEAEARFAKIAERFESRYDATGREHFALRAEAFGAKGEAMAARFEAKLERFEAQNAAREAAREHGKALAKGHDR